MSHPLKMSGARICVLVHPDEITVCANITGFKALGTWMAWLADSNPEDLYHFHLLWSLESEASRFDGVRPKNVWFLQTPPSHLIKSVPPNTMKAVPFEITFQVLSETLLDELATAQEDGFIPPKYLKEESSCTGHCD